MPSCSSPASIFFLSPTTTQTSFAGFIAEAARVLKPGGRFLLLDAIAPDDAAQATLMNSFERLRDPRHVRALSVPEWTYLIGENGLQLARAQRDRIRYDFPSWVRRTAADEHQIELVEHAILEMPRFARAYFSVCSAGSHVLSLEVDGWKALAVRSA